MGYPWKRLSEAKIPDEDLKVIYYGLKPSDKSTLFLVLEDGTIVFQAHFSMADWRSALKKPNKGIKYGKDIHIPKDGNYDPKDKSWMKQGTGGRGTKDNFYVIDTEDLYVLGIFLSLPYEASGILLENSDIRTKEGGGHSPIELVEWILSYLKECQINDVVSAVREYLKAEEKDKQDILKEINSTLCDALDIQNTDIVKICEQLQNNIEKDFENNKEQSKLLIDGCDGVDEKDLYDYQLSLLFSLPQDKENLIKYLSDLPAGVSAEGSDKISDKINAREKLNYYLGTKKLTERMKRNLNKLKGKQ
ncbi:MAG: hypothetical protein J6S17_00615 [Aeriscardovia sp.]|nr:hypothetical protein [Aeriscardovia sp.]